MTAPLPTWHGTEGHEHFCKVCSKPVHCWLDCGTERIDGRLLAGSVICDDCHHEGKTEDDAR